MPRWLLWTPVAALTVAAAFFGLRAGNYVSELSESDVINAAAQSYFADAAGRRVSDCSAVASNDDGVWLEIICQSNEGDRVTYTATRLGQVRRASPVIKQPET